MEEIAKYDPQIVLPELSPHPGDKWLNGASSFEGTLRHEGKILLASLRQVIGSQDLYIETVAPLDGSVEARMRRDKSVYVAFVVQQEDMNITVSRTGIIEVRKSKGSPLKIMTGRSVSNKGWRI